MTSSSSSVDVLDLGLGDDHLDGRRAGEVRARLGDLRGDVGVHANEVAPEPDFERPWVARHDG